MKIVAVLIAFSTLGAFSLTAAEGQADRLKEDTPAKRVASIHWDTQSGKLQWVVQDGVERNGEFVPSSSGEAHYEISPEEAVMAFQGQQRGFTDQEATWLQHLLHVLTVYCAESTVWWDQGQGTPLDHGKPKAQPPSDDHDPNQPDTNPHKVVNPPLRQSPGSVRLVAVRLIQ
jgi:hypothetical protein